MAINGNWYSKKKFLSKSEAMIFEYKLKKDRNKRQQLILKSEKKN